MLLFNILYRSLFLQGVSRYCVRLISVQAASDYIEICFKLLAIHHLINGESETFGNWTRNPDDINWFNHDNDNILHKIKTVGSKSNKQG